MTDNKISVEIARAVGLSVSTEADPDPAGVWRYMYFSREAAKRRRSRWPNSAVVKLIPDYPNDLNAIREVVMELNSAENDSKGRAVAFCKALEEVQEEDSCCWIECAVPSARQLCRAYLRAPERKEWEE